MKARDTLAFVITLSLPSLLLIVIVGIILLALAEREIPPILVDLLKILLGAFVGYVGGVATAFFGR